MSAVVVLVVAAAVALAWAPVRPRTARARSAAPARGAWWVARWPGTRRRRRPPDLAVVVTEVASRLRTGAPPATAWALTVERALGPAPRGSPWTGRDDYDGVPPALSRLVQHCATDPATASAARTVLTASRLTHDLGAPLAEVLDRCAATVTEAEHARDARHVALAGPRSTARILAGLPPLGLLLGAGLGADPVAAATDGGWGTASVAAGLALLIAGRRWTGALVAAAERPTTVRRAREAR